MTQDRAVRPNPGRGLARVWRQLMAAVSNAIIADGERATRLRRARLAGVIGVIGHPLYFVIWSYVFPQPYESVWLRGCVRCCSSRCCLPIGWPGANGCRPMRCSP